MRKQRLIRLSLWSFTCIGIVLVLKYGGLGRPMEWTIQTILAPLQGWLYAFSIPFQDQTTGLDWEELKKENQALRDQINNLLVENTQLNQSLEEVQAFEKQLKAIGTVQATSVSARIIGRGLGGDSESVMMNAGKNQGIPEGAVVLGGSGVVVGRVSRVDAATSIVTLITSPNSAMAASIQNETKSPGLLRGEHGLALRLSYIPQTDPVKPNDVVITSSLDPVVPEALVIGTVATVNQSPGGLFQEATVTPLFNPEALQLVTVVIPL